MAIIRKKELKEKTGDELKAELEKLLKEVHAERASVKTTGKPKNAGKYRETKRLVARIRTMLAQRKIRV